MPQINSTISTDQLRCHLYDFPTHINDSEASGSRQIWHGGRPSSLMKLSQNDADPQPYVEANSNVFNRHRQVVGLQGGTEE